MKPKLDVHVFTVGDDCFLYDSGTYRCHKIDRELYDIFAHDQLPEISAVPYKYRSFIGSLSEYVPEPFREPNRRITGMLLNVTHECNMNCIYCYAGGGSYGTPAKDARMSDDTARKAVDLLVKLAKDSYRLNITFFGGEPTLNFDLIPRTVTYARQKAKESGKTVAFSIVTNGTLLNDKICRYLMDNNILLVVSLDGDKEINDTTKKFHPSHFDTVINNLTGLKNRNFLAVRTTLSKVNFKYLTRVIDCFSQNRFSMIQFEDVTSDSKGLAFSEQDNPVLFEQFEQVYDKLVNEISLFDTKTVYPFIQEIFRIAFKRKDVHGCSAGRSNISIDCNGRIYPCHRMVGDRRLSIGTVDKPFDWKRLDPYFLADITHKEPCRTCWARHICSGGCVYASHVRHNDLTRIDEDQCARKQRLIELAAYQTSKLSQVKILLLAPRILHSLRTSPGHLLKEQDLEYAEQMAKSMSRFLGRQLITMLFGA